VLASTARTEDGSTDVVAVAADGRRLQLDERPAPGCAACELALRESRLRGRRAVGAGDVAPAGGDELLVEEELAGGPRLLSVLVVDGAALVRAASLLLEQARPGFMLQGTAHVVEADADPQREIVLATTELRTEGDRACALERHAELYDLPAAGGLVRIDPLKLPLEPADAAVNAVVTLDVKQDAHSASRACAALLARGAGAAVAQVCLQRISVLLGERRLVEATNAAALVAEAAPALRAVVAGPLHDAVSALDKDPRLTAAAPDCQSGALVTSLQRVAPAEAFKEAAARAAERVSLLALDDAVFVTGARDFGEESPVGVVTARWLERMRIAVPARYAAIEALLLPPAPPPAPVPVSAAPAPDAAPGFGGSGEP
jgi:hypothetical protein